MPESRDIYQCPKAAATLKYFRYSTAIFMNWSRTNCIYSLCTCAQSQAHLSVITSWGKCHDLCLSYQWCQTYSCIHISHTQWSIHMNAIYKYEYDSHPTSVTQSVSQATLSHSLCGPALLFTQMWNHKRDNQPSSIVLNQKKKKKLVSTQTLPHSLYAFAWCCCLCFLEHSVEREGREGVVTRNIRNIIWIWLSEGGKGRASWAK